MQVRLLLGPAGCGKTSRCVAGIREALRAGTEGPPLVFLAPKQSTFQLERQILSDQSLPGYTRLHLVSFERLAERILAALNQAPQRLLGEEGRVMVLRGLLRQHRQSLRLFHAAARLPGFALEASRTLRELQQLGLSPARLREVASREPAEPRLSDKLHDLALLLASYLRWLTEHKLEDAGRLLDLAAAALRAAAIPAVAPPPGFPPGGDHQAAEQVGAAAGRPSAALRFGGLWLDGFAEMTPQELDLLCALLPFCERATLAFCLEEPGAGHAAWHSSWSTVSRTVAALHRRLNTLADVLVRLEVLPRHRRESRFAPNSPLGYLEAHWNRGASVSDDTPPPLADGSIRVVACPNPETEAIVAARKILRHTRERGGRFRDTAVLVRSLDTHAAILRRVFTRYGIPFFMDRREPVSHHPMAELTRCALRTVAFGWRAEDWFGALKTGLVPLDEDALDRLENEALARGWDRKTWLEPFAVPDASASAAWAERLRDRLIPPFTRLARAIEQPANPPTGESLVGAIRAFWHDLGVETRLAEWSATTSPSLTPGGRPPAQVHRTVWEQMNGLLENLRLAFGTEALPLREWLPILEAGLGSLTVGAIPPALDQVLVGAVDRSRNPDLSLALVLGMNESVFPSPPPRQQLLTETDRAALTRHGVELLADERSRLGRERYYAYIACTRARQALVLTYAERDAQDRPLNPSPFIAQLQRLFPRLRPEPAPRLGDWRESEHSSELLPLVLQAMAQAPSVLPVPAGSDDTGLPRLVARLAALPADRRREGLSPALAERLYGPRCLKCSVSRLEQFAACPFQFLVSAGLRAEERPRFELDARKLGSFQHEVLARFHAELRHADQRWRDLTPTEARERIGRIADQVTRGFGAGLLRADDESLLTAHSLKLALQDYVEVAIGWMHSGYEFDPAEVELGFGGPGAALPAWELPLDAQHALALRGIIDRIDLHRDPTTGTLWCLVLDYKSVALRLDDLLLANGIQLQLPVYLAALSHLAPGRFGAAETAWLPAGMFYIPLHARAGTAPNRSEGLAQPELARREAHRHRGRFRAEALPRLDRLHDQETPSGQFSSVRPGRSPRKYTDVMSATDFAALLGHAEEQLRGLGRRVFAGEASVDPYARGATEVACGRCRYASICRIDPWTHTYRKLVPGGQSDWKDGAH